MACAARAAATVRVHVHMIGLPTEESVTRAVKRYASRGRLVDPRLVKEVGSRPKDTFDIIIQRRDIDGFSEYSNDVPQGAPLRLLQAEGHPPLARPGGERAQIRQAGL